MARFETKLEAIYKEARDFHSRERISEAKSHLEKLDELNVEVDNLIAEVSDSYCLFRITVFRNFFEGHSFASTDTDIKSVLFFDL